MQHGTDILLSLFVIFVAARVAGWLARAIKLPGVVGEIVAGCVIGPSVLGWIAPSEPLEVLSEIGVVLLLFAVGLETRIDEMKRVGRSAFFVGLLGVIVPFLFGSIWAHGSGFDWAKSLFIAAAFVATSAGITARVLQELGVLQREESRVILGAAVIDDILAMLLLGIVTALQAGENVQFGKLAIVLLEAIGFVVVIGLLGTRLARRSGPKLDARKIDLLPAALALCLGLAFLSTQFGLAAIIGAFLAGMVASETPQHKKLEHDTQPLLMLMTPFFFVLTGAKIELQQLASADALLTLAVITAIALVSKLIGGGLGALALGKRGALIVGIGMMPRGEVGVVIASLGLAAGVFSPRTYALIVAMSLITSIVTPPLLALLFKRERGAT
ncbi:MAG: cation:proton antiporter [Rudaea sp.]|uniref:cation:proton antiporter n=1 Tax=unclassified Rudaea TaxID=2627037 RepID=UPI0010F8C7D7|nr:MULTISPECIES: cation:proton antiporter [unclassified Rudaea]MBN8884407.1 cation:proton antiporter [Rudaea sp.]MBR0344413.1 cation:proton antiporter [Rudaea sp.]